MDDNTNQGTGDVQSTTPVVATDPVTPTVDPVTPDPAPTDPVTPEPPVGDVDPVKPEPTPEVPTEDVGGGDVGTPPTTT